MQIFIISGYSCTGKTTLAKKLSKELNLPTISKDLYKELLFDNLGVKDIPWSRELGKTSYRLLYHQIEQYLKFNQPFIVESNFTKQDEKHFKELRKKYNFKAKQYICKADQQTLIKRFWTRKRHEGHRREDDYNNFLNNMGQPDPHLGDIIICLEENYKTFISTNN